MSNVGSGSPGTPPLQVTGQRLARPGSSNSSGSAACSPPPSVGSPASPLAMQTQQSAATVSFYPSGAAYTGGSHPPSPVSRFNSGLMGMPGALSASVGSPSSGAASAAAAQARMSLPIRPQARTLTAGGAHGFSFHPEHRATAHPVHSTAVQALHSVGKAAAASTSAAPKDASMTMSSLRSAANSSPKGSASGSGPPSPGSNSRKVKHGTAPASAFPRIPSGANSRAGSAAASPSASMSDLRGGGCSPVRAGASPPMQTNQSMLHPRSAGARSSMKVARTPPQSQKKRPNSNRRNSGDGSSPVTDADLPGRFEELDLMDTERGVTPTSGYSSDASTSSHVSSFPYASYGSGEMHGAAVVGLGGHEDEELAQATSAGGQNTPGAGSRFPTPSSPMQIRAGGAAPTPHRMAGLPATPTTKPATPLRSNSRVEYPSSCESSALQSPMFDTHLAASTPSLLPPSVIPPSRAPAPFSYPLSPTPSASLDSPLLSSFDTEKSLATPGFLASLTPQPQAAFGGIASPAPPELTLQHQAAHSLPKPHPEPVAVAGGGAGAANSPRNHMDSKASVLSLVGLRHHDLQSLALVHAGGGATSGSSAFSSTRSLGQSASTTSLGGISSSENGAGSSMDWQSTPGTARSFSGEKGGMGGGNSSNTSSAASLHQFR